MPRTRRQLYRRRRVGVAAIVAVALAAGTYLPATLLAPVDAAAVSVDAYEPPATVVSDLAWPDFGASAVGAIGFDGTLSASGTSEPLPIASISKIITALVVLDAKPLSVGAVGPTITFTAADAALYGEYLRVNGKVEPVAAGVQMTERQVLEVMLVSSANNYAESLAGWAFGSQDAFVAAATAWLASNGFADTRLVEPTGMSALNVSTVTDLVGIGKLALAHPVVSEIVAASSVEVPYIGRVDNSNDLLGIDGIDGIKTGTLDEAGACLLFSADYAVGSQVVTVVGVVLGGVDHDSLDVAIRSLLASVENGFREVTLAEEGEAFAFYATPWDDRAAAVAAEEASVVLWSDTVINAEVAAREVTTASSGDPAGSVTFTAGDRVVEVPLVLDDEIDDPDPWWRLTHPLELIAD